MSPLGAVDDVGRLKQLEASPRRSLRRRRLPIVINNSPLALYLNDLVALPVSTLRVGHPDVALRVDVEAVGKDEHPGAPALEQLAGRIELQRSAAPAGRRSSSRSSDGRRRYCRPAPARRQSTAPHFMPGRQLRPVRVAAIRIGPIVDWRRALPRRRRLRRSTAQREGDDREVRRAFAITAAAASPGRPSTPLHL